MVSVTERPDSLTFEAPDGGSWMLDTTHHGRRPVTRFLQPIYKEVFPSALGAMVERYGLPLAEFRAAIINGCFYLRPMGIGEPEEPKGDPPLVLMKIISRVHPKLRRRNQIARQAWGEKRWRQDVDQWFEGERDATISTNLRFQDVEVGTLSDAELADHIAELSAHFEGQAYESGATHGGDIIPVGDFVAHCQQWGIETGDAAALLTGSSPASIETAEMLRPVGRALASVATPPGTLEELRALGEDVSHAIDLWLRYHGHRVVTSDDIDGETFVERPDLQLKALLSADPEVVEVRPPAPDNVRAMVPADGRILFDELLGEARYGLRLRDDNVGVRWNWSAGLVRRALLEAAQRLVARGRLDSREHVVEFESREVTALLRGDDGPSRDEMAARWQFREAVLAAEPPLSLGPDGGDPPVAAFPQPLARATSAVMAMIGAMQGEPAQAPLRGTGIGSEPHTGRALVVSDAIDALERLEPGDVVITPFTGPSWNSILPAVGALVVEEGGAMSHAAIVAREFAIPTIVGATGATTLILDGAQVTVDPTTGIITLHD